MKYEVEMFANVWVTIEVEADDPKAAEEKAYEEISDQDYEVDFQVSGVWEVDE